MSKQTQDHIVDVNKKVTAVEWFFEQIMYADVDIKIWREIYQQAKEMEEQQTIDAYVIGAKNQIYGVDLSGLEYYEKTFNK
jgi:hypothetical protein